MSTLPWKPWHAVVKLRDDLKSGELTLSMFAADLYEVVMRTAKPIYRDPEEFFALTVPTFNIQTLVKEVLARLSKRSDKAVRLLELTYGGGKTHTLITLLHLVRDPENLPDLPAVRTFVEAAGGRTPPQARVAVLAFDKLDAEKGMEIVGPGGERRWLRQPWSVLAWQLGGADGLRLLHAENRDEERETAPAENLFHDLLAMPGRDGLATLVLLDEVLTYARAKVGLDPAWRGRLQDFFQALTQAAAKVDRCAVVTSLVSTDPRKSDELGREIQSDLALIFRREQEEGIQPVLESDVAEVLRRRFFQPDSIKDPTVFQPHVIAALRGVEDLDEGTKKAAQAEQTRFAASYPFHPDLTKVLYEKWTNIPLFQKTRGVLRTFALALREAERWDCAPLVGANVFLSRPGEEDISEATRELASVAGLDAFEGPAQNWVAILQGELGKARAVQKEHPTLRGREIEQAVVATFLHSQPPGQNARAQTRDLMVLLGPSRPDRITLEKALIGWAGVSWFLDEATLVEQNGKVELPKFWRLGSRPNLRQMHHAASTDRVSNESVEARLLTDIEKLKRLTAGASPAGAKVYVLPLNPGAVADDGELQYAVLGPKAASVSGTTSTEARRFIEETTAADRPRVNRNAIVLAVPSRDGLDTARRKIRDYMGWEEVREMLKGQELDPLRQDRLASEVEAALKNIGPAIEQAYNLVTTVGANGDIQTFKLTVGGDVLFNVIKGSEQSRIRDTPISADALLPGGPYDLWRDGETARRVKDLVGAFSQNPKLPKMLRRKEILDTLTDGARQGFFVLRVLRPDRSARTIWRQETEAADLAEPSLEVVLPEAAELTQIPPTLLLPSTLPELWPTTGKVQVTLGDMVGYFAGGRVVQVRREVADGQSYEEPVSIPQAPRAVVTAAVTAAIEKGRLWLTAGAASLCNEPIPAGVLTDAGVLRAPPAALDVHDLLPDALPEAWTGEETTALGLSTCLSQTAGETLPWSTVREAVDGALRARTLERTVDSGLWPCPLSGAAAVKLRVFKSKVGEETQPQPKPTQSGMKVAEAELQSSEIQDLADIMGDLLGATVGTPLKFRLKIELGEENAPATAAKVQAINAMLKKISDGLELR